MNEIVNADTAKRDKKREAYRKWYMANKKKAHLCSKRWREANPEKMKAAKARWYVEHKEEEKVKARLRTKVWREANPEKAKAKTLAWNKANPDKVQSSKAKRRAIKRQVTIENFLVSEIYERDGWICQLCHKKVNRKLKLPNPMSASLDHIIPLIKGGSHSRANVQLAHLTCNVKAGVYGTKQLRIF